VYVSGHLGGAAAALAAHFTDPLLNARFYRPRARLDLAGALRTHAHAAIDISDGLVQDLGHLMRASGCACDIRSADVPVFTGATLADALYGGDDYELCFTSATPPPFPATRIGVVRTGQGVTVDGRAPARSGYRHFA